MMDLFTAMNAVLGVLSRLECEDACAVICMAVDDISAQYGRSPSETLRMIIQQIRQVNEEMGNISAPYGKNVRLTVKEVR